ncbi:4'-phosphopantetheinyl transferase superfamily protein, partial [Streptomyces sp. NPDC001941]|uniref:4'-phosphopantetheinyl transferase family protein n=1 Tax=Streptomyces sp. NPDC001941 TaxID=3154659 RepID=UPI00331C789C
VGDRAHHARRPPRRAPGADRHDDLTPAPLFPEESVLVAGRRPSRVRQFATARGCARRSMAALGLPPVAVPVGAGGAPRWPSGVVGSITHCDGYRAAAAALERDALAVGIDAEPAGPLPEGVLGLVASDAERAALPTAPGICWDRLLFSAKEAVYKAWYPGTRRWLGFRDAHLSLYEDGTFAARLLPVDLPPGAVREFTGRWLVDGGLAVTSVVVGAKVDRPSAERTYSSVAPSRR